MDDQPIAEIASETGVTKGTVSKRVKLGCRWLGQRIEELLQQSEKIAKSG